MTKKIYMYENKINKIPRKIEMFPFSGLKLR